MGEIGGGRAKGGRVEFRRVSEERRLVDVRGGRRGGRTFGENVAD